MYGLYDSVVHIVDVSPELCCVHSHIILISLPDFPVGDLICFKKCRIAPVPAAANNTNPAPPISQGPKITLRYVF